MTYKQYTELFEEILYNDNPDSPYDKPNYLKYARLNYSRMKRWMKKMELNEDLANALANMQMKQHWIIITEPWCGDAAHSLPFLVTLAEQSASVSYDVQLRDSEPFLIDQYLTNGGKSIPKLIVRNEDGNDLFTWGPRPGPAQKIRDRLKEEGEEYDTINIALQNWYNKDKGRTLQQELLEAFREVAAPD